MRSFNSTLSKRIQRKLTKYSNRAYKAVVTPYRLLTASQRSLPDFIIIGAQKCGTTSLYNFLVQHPHVNSAIQKEIHFFDQRYSKGINWYRSRFPFLNAGAMTGEASPNYILDPHTPKRIFEYLPFIKLIVLLRNPVDRAYSHYHHNLRANQWDKGRETLSFEEAIWQEGDRLSGELEKMLADQEYFSHKRKHYSYLSRGIYADQLQRWFNVFPRSSFFIIEDKELYSNTAETLQQICQFLGLSNYSFSNYRKLNALNYSDMNEETRKYLIDYFKPHNAKLYEILGREFDWDK
jgi:hypothetical protein